MSTDKAFAELVVGLLQPENVRVKAMFGEYCLYHNDKVVAFICDDRVLLKPTVPPLEQFTGLDQAEAYPGSKLYYVVPDGRLGDPWFRETVVALSAVLPAPKLKAKKGPAE
jgi:TfoX/Sxy family transcriptional regulator of competence genes